MTYNRGFRIYKPSPKTLIKEFIEGVDYNTPENPDLPSFSWSETSLITGETQYRYIVPFDDDIEGEPSVTVKIVNLLPPVITDTLILNYDRVQFTFNNVSGAVSYSYHIENYNLGTTLDNPLDSDKIVRNLNALTDYRIKVASVNSTGDLSAYSTELQIITPDALNLFANVSSHQVDWRWTYTVNTDSSHYELFREDGVKIGTFELISNNYLEVNLPVSRLKYYIVLVNTDGSKYTSNTVQADIYSEETRPIQYNATITTKSTSSLYYGVKIYRDLKSTLESLKIGMFTPKSSNFSEKTSIYQSQLSTFSFKAGVYRKGTDSHGVNQAIYVQGLNRLSGRECYYQPFDVTVGLNNPIYNSYTINPLFDLRINRTVSEKLDINLASISTGQTQVGTSMKVFESVKRGIPYKVGLNNLIKDNYIIKNGISNVFVNQLLTSVQVVTFNFSIAFDVNHRDIVYNYVTSEISLISNINKVRILCIGDSITAGAPLFDPLYGSGTVYMSDLVTGKWVTKMDKESSYPYWLQVRLGVDDYEVINEGTGRLNSTQAISKIDTLLKTHRPQYVVVLIGTNDIFDVQDRSKAEITQASNDAINNIRKAITSIKNYKATPVLGTNLPRNSIVPIVAKEGLKQLNQGIKALGVQNTVDVIDWYDLFVLKDLKIIDGEPQYVENGNLNPEIAGDATHPNIAGYKLMAEKINLATFNSFRALIRIFRDVKQVDEKRIDVDYDTEEPKVMLNTYTYYYTLTLPEMKRLQNYNITKYMKNTGNSFGMYVLEVLDNENLTLFWNDNTQSWTKEATGQLAPSEIKPLKIKFSMPSSGRNYKMRFKITFIEFRR